MNSPVRHLMQAGRLDRFFIDGEWIMPEGSDRVAVVARPLKTRSVKFRLGTHATSTGRCKPRAKLSDAGP